MIKNVIEEFRKKRAILGQLRRALGGSEFHTVFQPIVALHSLSVVGFEALTRFHGEPNNPPDVWFRHAKQVGLYEELEYATLNMATSQIDLLPKDVYVSLNVTASSVAEGFTADLVCNLPPDRIVLEISEQELIGDYEKVAHTLKPFRERGVRLAVDDVGAGYASLWHVLKMEPDIIKLDAKFVIGIDRNTSKRKLVSSILDYANFVGATLVTEGIETRFELDVLRDLGVDHGQGYFLGKPGPVTLYSNCVT